MSKPIKIVVGADLQSLFDQHPGASLRKLSQALEVNYGAILKASKAPVAGAMYDPEAVNWDQVATEFAKRNKDFTAVDWVALAESNRPAATVSKSLDGWFVGDLMYLRKNATIPYEVVYKTGTHMVLQLVGSTEPMVWSNSTVLLNGPSRLPRAEKIAE